MWHGGACGASGWACACKASQEPPRPPGAECAGLPVRRDGARLPLDAGAGPGCARHRGRAVGTLLIFVLPAVMTVVIETTALRELSGQMADKLQEAADEEAQVTESPLRVDDST